MTNTKMTPARKAAYATISAAMGGDIPAGHKDWLDAQDDARVVAIADEFHQPERPIPGTVEYDEETELMQEAGDALRHCHFCDAGGCQKQTLPT